MMLWYVHDDEAEHLTPHDPPSSSGAQPLLTANIIAMSLPMLLSSVKACAPFVAAFQTSAAMPITIAAVAFILNLIGTYSRAVDAAKYMSSVNPLPALFT
jgi:hypothetical protein